MPTNKFKMKYDGEYDSLYFYDRVNRSSSGIEWGNLDISYDKNGNIIGLSIKGASSFLTNLTNRKITKKALAKAVSGRLKVREKAGIIYLTFIINLENEAPIEDTITVKSINYKSPLTETA